jgi:hypothetical protein
MQPEYDSTMATARSHGPATEKYGVPFTIALMRASLDEPRIARMKRGRQGKRSGTARAGSAPGRRGSRAAGDI